LSRPATAKLTPQQITELETGQWNFNIQAHKNPGGEIRSQMICH
jgi:hypothetical protein